MVDCLRRCIHWLVSMSMNSQLIYSGGHYREGIRCEQRKCAYDTGTKHTHTQKDYGVFGAFVTILYGLNWEEQPLLENAQPTEWHTSALGLQKRAVSATCARFHCVCVYVCAYSSAACWFVRSLSTLRRETHTFPRIMCLYKKGGIREMIR